MSNATITAFPATCQLRHPEIDTPPVTAEIIATWRDGGTAIGLVLQFQGEHFYRKLTNAEIEVLQEEE